ncbi:MULTISPECIES: CinA family protein [Atopobiaceae]|uniref:CinA family protein n=1 Tax=Atopobiaceae TaxID=1643824 RepID=UPI000B394E34|nr:MULTISPECIES: CinA family protein [Atopobiaceae]MCR8907463.1 CinA family protein [Thermophilibacter sp. ET337]OUO32176.1 damage-inducible protein CinA [Olsenella sp. An293]
MAEREIFSDDPELYDACAELLELARGRGLTLGTAESCTGGLVCGCLTAVPGSSDVVRGGVVSYAIDVKRAVLGVADEVFEDPARGAVSPECAEQMARGARFVLGCDLAVSVTGIAGPGGEEPGKPVGTVWLGLSGPAGERSALLALEGDRAAVRRAAAREAVALLREGVVEERL